MSQWTMALAKRDFEIGYLSSYRLERFPMHDDVWVVQLKGGSAMGALVDARSKSPRKFKSLDAAVAAVEAIGFKVSVLE